MDDFEELVGDLKAGAERRGLRLLEATFPGDPAVIFHYGTIGIDDVLDIAQHSFAPFLSLGVTRLDPAELSDSWDPDDDKAEQTLRPSSWGAGRNGPGRSTYRIRITTLPSRSNGCPNTGPAPTKAAGPSARPCWSP